MKRFCIKLISAAIVIACSSSSVHAQGNAFKANVVAVIDGDTLIVTHDGKKEKVIMYGIDAPENGQEFGSQAKQFTDSVCYHKEIVLDVKGRDKFDRVIAEVFLSDGTDLNHELVKRGLAWWSDKYAASDSQLKSLHDSAKAAHLGLWSSPNPVPPWIFRNGEKATNATIVPSSK